MNKSEGFAVIIILVLLLSQLAVLQFGFVPKVYAQGAEYDYVDQVSNVDSVADKGTHSNFTAQQYGPDLINDTLTEADVGGNSENFVDSNTSNIDGHTGHGTSSNFTAQQDANVLYNDTLTEANTGGTTSDVFTSGFEEGPWNASWNDNDASPSWRVGTNSTPGTPWVTHSGTNMSYSPYVSTVAFNLTSDNIDLSGTTQAGVSFWYMVDDEEATDYRFYYYNGSTYNLQTLDLGLAATEDVWFRYTEVITASQYLISNFRLRFWSLPETGEASFADDVVVNKTIANNYELDYEFSWTTADFDETNEYLCIRTNNFAGTAENLGVDVWTGSWTAISTALTASTWNNISISAYLTSTTIYFRFIGKTESSDTAQNTWIIECNLIRVWVVNYNLDLEVQWTNANYTAEHKDLSIYVGSVNAENLQVDVRNGGSWTTIIAALSTNQWNNISISNYLTSSTFTIRFKGTVETEDTVQSTWQIDCALLHTWEGSWLSGYSYRKSHVINNATGAGTNYQMNITVINATGTDSNSKVYINKTIRSDFGDINFTDDDGSTCLDYWMETLNTGLNATFWVEVADSLESAAQTIYVYYGKSGATTTSNGDNTFLFFDHFPNSAIDTNKWTGDTAYASVSGSILNLTATNANHFIFSKSNYGANIAFRANVSQSTADGSTNHDSEDGLRTNNADTDELRIYTYNNAYWNAESRKAGTATGATFGTADKSYHIHQIFWTTTTVFYVDASTTTISTNVPTTAIPVDFRAYATSGYTTNTLADWVLLRKYVSPEPSHGAWGGEETTPAEAANSVTLNSPSNGATVASLTVNFNYTPIFYQTIQNSSLWTNTTGSWARTQWNTTTVVNNTLNTISYAFSSGGKYLWNVQVFNSTGSQFASANWTVIINLFPTYSNVGTNTTVAGQPCQFQTLWNDDVNVTGYIFGTNNSVAQTYNDLVNSLPLSRYGGNPILHRGGAGSWEEQQVYDPCVFEESTQLVMFYSGAKPGVEAIGRATAPLGQPENWTKYGGNPILTGETGWENGNARLGSIIKINDTYYLYYSGGTVGTYSIGRANSTNGINWTKYSGNPVFSPVSPETSVENPAVIRVDATHWYMYYAYRGPTTLSGFKVATSSDGISWTYQATVLQIGAGGTWDDTYIEWHQIILLGSDYILVYEGYDGSVWAIGIATSTNSTGTFTKYAGNPIFQKSGVSGAFDQYQVATGAFCKIGTNWDFFFCGGNAVFYGDAVWEMGLAYLQNWVNETWVPFSTFFNSTAAWSNITKTLNSVVGSRVEWRIWANDTSNNWNNTGIQYLITTSAGINYIVDLSQSISATLSPTTKLDFTLTITQSIISTLTPTLIWNSLLTLQSQPSITLTQTSKTDFRLQISGSVTNQFTKTEKTNYTLNPASPVTATFTSAAKSDFTLQIGNPNTIDFLSLPAWDTNFVTSATPTITLAQVAKTNFILTFNSQTTSTFNLPTIQWNSILNIQTTPTITFEKTTRTDFTLTFSSPIGTSWLVDVIHTHIVSYIVDLACSISSTLSLIPKSILNIAISSPTTISFEKVSETDFTLTLQTTSTPSFTLPVPFWSSTMSSQFQPSITFVKVTQSTFILAIDSSMGSTFTMLPQWNTKFETANPITITHVLGAKSDFVINTSNPISTGWTLNTATNFILNIPQSITTVLSTAMQTTFTLAPQTSMSISLAEVGKADFTLTIGTASTATLGLTPEWNATLSPQLQPSITLEKITQTNFLITINNPATTNWLLEVIHTSIATYTVDLSTAITTSFETVKQWLASIIITTQPSVTLIQVTKSDFVISFSSSVATGWTLDATIPTAGPTGGSWPPARITLFTQAYAAIVDAWRFVWTVETAVSVNVTIVNESPYTSGTLFYQIVNLDTNQTMKEWTTGETILIEPNGNTTITITTNIPIQRSFEPEHFRVNVKLSLMREVIEAETDFTVEKDMVKQFFGNVTVLGLCMGLVGVALYSYKQKPKPWEKYPTTFKKKRYPERKGKG